MSEEEVEEPQNSAQSGGQHFPVGSPVELLVNEAELSGVRFVCSVVPPPRKIAPENEGKLYLMYKSLLARKGRPERLREFADVSSLRPAPPPPHKKGKRFEVKDVVEAYYQDGWWKGVVTGVERERFLVTFDDPPDEHEFGLSRLRPLWDWADGLWFWPHQTGGNAFKVGDKVEISIDIKGAWFPGVIVRDSGNGVYSVELKDKNGGSVEQEVECVDIRPSPPVLADGKFGVSEKVDAFLEYGWWSGLIKKKVKMDEYIVLFDHTDSDSTKVLDRSELRPHLEWKDGKWLIECGNSKRSRKSTSPDSRLSVKKHKPQIDDVEYDRERRSKRTQDVQIPSMLPLIDEDEDSRAPQNLPFVKRNAIWKSIESTPQTPHFEPLRAFKESQREGLAIGCMVTFSNAVEASRKLKFNDPKSVADDLQETLLYLETYGFDVGALREPVMKLLKAKEEEERLVGEAKGIMGQIEVRSGRRGEIEGKMRRLQEQLTLAERDKEQELEEIGRLQAGLEDNLKQMESLRSDFEAV